MNINSIAAMILVVIIIVLAVNYLPQITTDLTAIHRIGPGNSADDKVTGLIVIGFLGAILVAVVKILTTRNTK